MGIIVPVLPCLMSILTGQVKKRKNPIRCLDPKDGQNIDVAII